MQRVSRGRRGKGAYWLNAFSCEWLCGEFVLASHLYVQRTWRPRSDSPLDFHGLILEIESTMLENKAAALKKVELGPVLLGVVKSAREVRCSARNFSGYEMKIGSDRLTIHPTEVCRHVSCKLFFRSKNAPF